MYITFYFSQMAEEIVRVNFLWDIYSKNLVSRSSLVVYLLFVPPNPEAILDPEKDDDDQDRLEVPPKPQDDDQDEEVDGRENVLRVLDEILIESKKLQSTGEAPVIDEIQFLMVRKMINWKRFKTIK